ncbi:hypothetical protein AltI4_22490 [Alteromonas sp. I4]|nr:hypothetical protein AltI4_22490 [Alteromonas sp. I4]
MLYIDRILISTDKEFTELELLEQNECVIVLAEPGAGKTELLKSLAKRLNVRMFSANVFRHLGSKDSGKPVVIDAFDELAKIDDSAIHPLLSQVESTNPSHFIISSRSSEWDHSSSRYIYDYLGKEPIVVRLNEFNKSEIEKIYINYTERKDFDNFYQEINNFNLSSILPNPQFLKVFADAYLETGGKFTSKNEIYSQAVSQLARESNAATKPVSSISHREKINYASEVFAKLLLSGSEGISISEVSENRMYPTLANLARKSIDYKLILSTRLFKPCDNSDHHQPIHKIIAEYCAANYFINRIDSDSLQLAFPQLISIMAPNNVVRNELRGVIGWMASLGNKNIQECLINLDPYAVLANGDPSQLISSSKALLLKKLRDTEINDPYFRRGDFQRKFNDVNFFSEDIIPDLKTILLKNTDGHLKSLVLELLAESKISTLLDSELREIAFTKYNDEQIRILALNCLLKSNSFQRKKDIVLLCKEASPIAFKMAIHAFNEIGVCELTSVEIENFLKSFKSIFEVQESYSYISKYTLKKFIEELELSIIENLLDRLNQTLSCHCGKKIYECECRKGMSKILGLLLDHYFVISKTPHDPAKIWQWTKDLYFTNNYNKDTPSVTALQNDKILRNGILEHVFSELKDPEYIQVLRQEKFDGYYSHHGLSLTLDDIIYLVDLAFENGNSELWGCFLQAHNYNIKTDYYFKSNSQIRRKMRLQSRKKPELMAIWASRHRKSNKRIPKYLAKYNRKSKRDELKERSTRSESINFINSNRDLIIKGEHWGSLMRFSWLTLDSPEEIQKETGDENLVRTSLKNCFNFIEPFVPDLNEICTLRCNSEVKKVEIILFAACLETMRSNKNLNAVPVKILTALRTRLNTAWRAVEQEEIENLKIEVDRQLFPEISKAELFLRNYIEPQLSNQECKHPPVDILKYDNVFKKLRAELSLEWLNKYRNAPIDALSTLFELAVQSNEIYKIENLILEICSELFKVIRSSSGSDKINELHKFWFVRAFYFLDFNISSNFTEVILKNKKSIFIFESISGTFGHHKSDGWPDLCSRKVEALLLAYIDEWPKVNLPDTWGTDSPDEERAYRFLRELVWSINKDTPKSAIPVLDRLLLDSRFRDFNTELRSIKAEQVKIAAIQNFEPPCPNKVVDFLDRGKIITVEVMRQTILQELQNYQLQIRGGEFNTARRFYTKDNSGDFKRLNEIESVNIVAEYLSNCLKSQDISIVKEHETKAHNRIDITATKTINGIRRLLVIEAKGQWHKDLYSAAKNQLYQRYSIHPDAEQQGIYLVFWFGSDEKVANRKNHAISSAEELKDDLELTVPSELSGQIDIFVLDVSSP